MKNNIRKPEVSVIMVAHNREQFIVRAIESILAQTFQNFEFIIVDNGSVDSSGQLAEQYAQNDSRITIIHIPESTIGAARNVGLDACTGAAVAFIDDDDYACSEMLDFLYQNLCEQKADISLCGSYRAKDGKNRPFFVYDKKYLFDAEGATVEYLKRELWNAPLPTKMMRRELFEKIRFQEARKYDDIHVAYRYFVHARKVVAEGKALYIFTDHEGNHSLAATRGDKLHPELLEEYFSAFRERTAYISEYLPNISAYARYSEWSYMISMCNRIETHHLSNCRKHLIHIKEELRANLDEFRNSPYLKTFEEEWLEQYILK